MKPLSKLVLLLLSLSLLLTSCRGSDADCHTVLSELSYEMNIGYPVYSPTVSEGDEGYCQPDLFKTLYGLDGVAEDYAVIFCSTLDRFSEISLVLCYTEYDAHLVQKASRERLLLVLGAGGEVDTSLIGKAEIRKIGRWVITAVTEENSRIMRFIESRV